MKNRFKITSSALVIAGALALAPSIDPSVARAEPVARSLDQTEFEKGDTDGDGLLTLAEFDEYVITLFSAADVDQDSYLNMEESAEASPKEFAKLDLDMDKKLSFQEVMRVAHVNFRTADKNNDKMVSAIEARSFGS